MGIGFNKVKERNQGQSPLPETESKSSVAVQEPPKKKFFNAVDFSQTALEDKKETPKQEPVQQPKQEPIQEQNEVKKSMGNPFGKRVKKEEEPKQEKVVAPKPEKVKKQLPKNPPKKEENKKEKKQKQPPKFSSKSNDSLSDKPKKRGLLSSPWAINEHDAKALTSIQLISDKEATLAFTSEMYTDFGRFNTDKLKTFEEVMEVQVFEEEVIEDISFEPEQEPMPSSLDFGITDNTLTEEPVSEEIVEEVIEEVIEEEILVQEEDVVELEEENDVVLEEENVIVVEEETVVIPDSAPVAHSEPIPVAELEDVLGLGGDLVFGQEPTEENNVVEEEVVAKEEDIVKDNILEEEDIIEPIVSTPVTDHSIYSLSEDDIIVDIVEEEIIEEELVFGKPVGPAPLSGRQSIDLSKEKIEDDKAPKVRTEFNFEEPQKQGVHVNYTTDVERQAVTSFAAARDTILGGK